MHRFATPSAAVAVTAYLLTGIGSAVAGGSASAIGKPAGVASSAAAVAEPPSDLADGKLATNGLSLADLKDQAQVLMTQSGNPALQAEAIAKLASPRPDAMASITADTNWARRAPSDALQKALRRLICGDRDTVDQQERESVVTAVMWGTRINRLEAERRTDGWIKQYQEGRSQIKREEAQAGFSARYSGDDAAAASAQVRLRKVAALVLGALAIAVGAALAGRRATPGRRLSSD